MLRLIFIFITIPFFLFLVSADNGDVNSSDEYTIQQLVIISFDDPVTSDSGNVSEIGDSKKKSLNQTDQGEGMTAKKLFKLTKAAKSDFQRVDAGISAPISGLTPTAAQSVAIVCKQCIPIKTDEI